MSDQGTPASIVVIERPRRKAGVAFIAAGAIAATALLGGGTFALWQAQSKVDGGTITAGDLNITTATPAFYDVSADRADIAPIAGTDVSGHAINDLTAYRVVPGDKVAAVVPVKITLSGDNLVAKMTVALPDAAKSLTGDLTYAIYDAAGTAVVSPTALTDGATLGEFSAPMTGQTAGASDAKPGVIELNSTTQDFTIVVYDTFDASVANQDQVGSADVLGNVAFTLSQVRADGASFTI